ncbi:MAG: phosphoribosylaminoimidazolesuccinocarboxamide synthase [Chlamydiota bacterium]
MTDTALKSTFLPELGKRTQGKVRDIYEDKNTLKFITSDRISVFDRVLNEAIPDKGRILNEISLFWFDKTKDIIPNHFIQSIDPNVMVVLKCKPFMVEVIVRNYLTGSLWRTYEKGERRKCGILLPEGLKKHDQLPHIIITPSTKSLSGHDEDISKEELIDKEIVTKEQWNQIEKKSLKLFRRGQEVLKEKGIILVDTKYEFGTDENGNITLIDEVHTPDSSRFWFTKDFERNELNFPDKEFAREYCRNHGFIGEGVAPIIPEEVISKIQEGYKDVYETITGKILESINSSVPIRVLKSLREANLIKGYFVVLITSNEIDQPHTNKIASKLEDSGIPYASYLGPRYTAPKKCITLIEEYNQSLEPVVCIIVEKESNALSEMFAEKLRWPVIACPSLTDTSDYIENIRTWIQEPNNAPVLTVIGPENAALAAKKILKSMELTI